MPPLLRQGTECHKFTQIHSTGRFTGPPRPPPALLLLLQFLGYMQRHMHLGGRVDGGQVAVLRVCVS